MPYLNTRMVAAIAMFATLWGVLNSIFAPVVFSMTGLPILCDIMGFAVLTLTVWWTRKFGTTTMVGLIATVVNFIFNPAGVHFLGFWAASAVFDVAARLIGYGRCFKKPVFVTVTMLPISVSSAAAAGLIIGTFFMATAALTKWGGVLGWAGLHAVGGAIGGLIGIVLVTSLAVRGVQRMDLKE